MSRELQSNISRLAASRKNMFFPKEGQRDMVVADHNIKEVLAKSDEATKTYVSAYYQQRGWHIPKPSEQSLRPDPATNKPRTRMGLLIENTNQDVLEHLAYIRSLSGLPIESINPTELSGNVLAVPYINNSEASTRLRKQNAEPWGLPPTMTDAMKNKADAHDLLAKEHNSENFRVADYTITEVEDVAKTSISFLHKVEEIYTEAGLSNEYKNKLGIVLRASESDGNYGNCIVKIDGNSIVLIKDGASEKAEHFEGTDSIQWHKAFVKAQEYLTSTMNKQLEKRVVISRMADILDSPGMTVSIVDGHVLSWGWNGQLMLEGSKACVGASTYPATDIKKEFEDQSAKEYENFLRWLAEKQHINFSNITAVSNVDLMVPSDLEFELQKRRKQKRHLLIAEFNPRFSEFSDSVVGATLFYPIEQTTETFRRVNENGIYTFAKYPLPRNVAPRDVRTELYEIYANRKDDGLSVVRMAPPLKEDHTLHPTMGVVVYGDKQTGLKNIHQAVMKVAKK